jgi:uncharacterized membrane protein YczE
MKSTICRFLQAAAGLIVAAFGTYLMIQANIGVSPWDTLNLGLTHHLPISYGTASVLVSVLVLAVDLVARERIGLGTLLDAVLVGKAVDFFTARAWISQPLGFAGGVVMMVLGMLLVGIGQYVYMKAGLCCGPRDSLMLALGRRVRRIPIGAVNIALLSAVTLAGWLLGGPVGVGTLLSAFGLGGTMQLVFRLMRFDPRSVAQEDLALTCRRLKNNLKFSEKEPKMP